MKLRTYQWTSTAICTLSGKTSITYNICTFYVGSNHSNQKCHLLLIWLSNSKRFHDTPTDGTKQINSKSEDVS